MNKAELEEGSFIVNDKKLKNPEIAAFRKFIAIVEQECSCLRIQSIII